MKKEKKVLGPWVEGRESDQKCSAVGDRLADSDDILLTGSPVMRVVELASVHDRQSLHEELARALDFPEYYGQNWDAFVDSMTDLATREPASRVLFRGYALLEASLPAEALNLRECLAGLYEKSLQILWE